MGQGVLQVLQLCRICRFHIQLDAGKALQLLLQLLIDIIPIGPVVLQEIFKFRLILQHQIRKTRSGQRRRHIFNAARNGGHSQFKPSHSHTSP